MAQIYRLAHLRGEGDAVGVPVLRRVLIADDEASIRHSLALVLTAKGYDVRAVADGQEALDELAQQAYDVVISDVRMPKVDGLELLRRVRQAQPELHFVVMSAYGSKDIALDALRLGAFDFVEKPFKPEEIVFVLERAEERTRLVRENRRLKYPTANVAPLERLLGQSEPLGALKKQIARVAPAPTTVLVTGESGTGKELVARALHDLSPRAPMPFVALNCGAIPAGLLESELFGHARGAFTDARVAKRGLFAEADGGTMFLDEVGELPMEAQVKLLRVLEEGEIRPVGESRVEHVNVRVIAATLRDLQQRVARGLFREDLYFRLNVVQLTVPSLRERRGDIVLLAREFLSRFSRAFNTEPPLLEPESPAEQALLSYAWPGNVRELENAMERAVLLTDGATVTLESLPEKLWTSEKASARHSTLTSLAAPSNLSLKRAIESLEMDFIRAALRQTKGNRTRAAEQLEISHRALLYKIKEYGIDADAEGQQG